MGDYIILTDSSCDLPAALAEELELVVVPLSFLLDDRDYLNYLDGRDMAPSAFYGALREGKLASTSAANIRQFTEAMEPVLAAGHDILYLGFSSGLSGTCNSGAIAAEELSAKYPERRILTVDTLCASLGQGLLIYLTVQQRRAGKSLEEARDFAEANKLHLCHWFTVDDLHHLKRMGRLSSAGAFVGSVLNIKPVLHVDDAGHLVNVGKARGRKNAIKALAAHMAESAQPPRGQTVFISHGDCEEDARYLADKVQQLCEPREIVMNCVGPVIGAHSGAGTLALFFLGTQR